MGIEYGVRMRRVGVLCHGKANDNMLRGGNYGIEFDQLSRQYKGNMVLRTNMHDGRLPISYCGSATSTFSCIKCPPRGSTY